MSWGLWASTLYTQHGGAWLEDSQEKRREFASREEAERTRVALEAAEAWEVRELPKQT